MPSRESATSADEALAFNLEENPVPSLPSMRRSLSRAASNKSYSPLELEDVSGYENKTGFNLVKLIRETQQRSNKGGDVFSADLASELGGSGLLSRVKDWAGWILPDNCEIDLEELLLGDTMIDPIGYRLHNTEEDTPLTEEEVGIMKDQLLLYLRRTGRQYTDEALEKYKHDEPSRAFVSGAEHVATREQIRLANKKLPSTGSRQSSMTIREWYGNLPLGTSPSAVSQVDGSPLLLGNGPMGGHQAPGKHSFWKDSWKITEDNDILDQHLGETHGKVMKALYLHGCDINSNGVDHELRDAEVASFLIGMLEMKVKAVVACGYVNAHEESNMKTLTDMKPYYNPKTVLTGQGLYGSPAGGNSRLHPSYQKGAPRDFFNYFGCCDGDDGINWKTIDSTRTGLTRKQAYIAGLKVTSTCLLKDMENCPIDSSYKVAAYRLQISWREGRLWWGQRKEAELRVMHIAAMDQMPLQLTRKQVRVLYNIVAGTPTMDSVGLGFQERGKRVFAHCQAGLGRTGDLAMGLTEILCDGTPSDPKDKLLWLRKFRHGLVQTPEQLIDGLQLAATLIDDVYERAKYLPLQLLAEQKSLERGRMQVAMDEAQAEHNQPKNKGSPVRK